MVTSPRLSFYALFFACFLGAPAWVFGQQPPARDTASGGRAVQHLAPQRISGTRLTPADSASQSVAARVDVVSATDLRRVAPSPAAIAQALSGLTGVSVFDDQGTRAQPTIDLRGWTLSPVVGVPQGVSVFLDGVRINEADAQEVNFDLVPTEALASTSLIRGPITLYGKNTLAGAILLTTKRGGEAPPLDAGVSAGRFGYREAHVSSGGVTTSPFGALDGFVLARGSEESGFRDETPATTRLLFANIGRRSANPDGSDLAVSLLYAHDRVYQAGSLPESRLRLDPRENYTPGDFFAPDLLHGALRATIPLGAASLRGNLFVRRVESEQFNVNIDAPSSRAHVDAASPGTTLELDLPAAFAALTLGAEGSRDAVRYRVTAEPTASAPTLPDDCDAGGLCENARVDSDNGALFGQLIIPLVRSDSDGAADAILGLTIAARADYVRTAIHDIREPRNDGSSTFWRGSPRAALTYRAARGGAYVAINTAFRTPAALELACADENAPCVLPFSLGDDPPLAPVTVTSYEAGANWSPRSWLAAEWSVYRSRVRNEIVFAASSRTAGYFRNIPRTRRQGLELAVRAERRRPGSTLRVFGQYALVDAQYESSIQLASALPDEPSITSGDRLPLSPRHRGAVGIGATILSRLAIVDAELRARGASSQLLRGDEANTRPPLPGYALGAAHLSMRRDRIAVGVDVDNLFDKRFATFGTFAPDPLAAVGSGPPPIARFVTPGYPRSLTLSLSSTW
jgi:outer membrane receptor protein involved in Fe transport